MNRILIINPFGIGDVLFTTPLISALRRTWPKSFLGFLCNARTFELLSTNPHLDRVFVFEKDEYRALWRKSMTGFTKRLISFLKEIRKQNFDLAVDLSLGHQYSLGLMLLGLPRRLGYNFKGRGRFLTDKIDIDGYGDKHIVEYYMDLLEILEEIETPHPNPFPSRIPGGSALFFQPAHHRGVLSGKKEETRGGLEVFLNEGERIWADKFLLENGISEENSVVGIIPGAGASWGLDASYKHWPPEGFAEVGDGLIENFGAKVIVFGDHKELEICGRVFDLMSHKPIMACGKTSLRQFAALLERCRLVICNDGGPLHLAVAMGAKTVSIFGPVDERVYGPYPNSPNHIVVKADVECRPCYTKFRVPQCKDRRCLKKVSSSQVLETAKFLIDGRTQAFLQPQNGGRQK